MSMDKIESSYQKINEFKHGQLMYRLSGHAVLAEWAYEQLQIQVAESHGSQVQIPFGPI